MSGQRIIEPSKLPFVEAVAKLTYCNPFLDQRIELEKAALGADFQEREEPWNLNPTEYPNDPNVRKLIERVETTAEECRERLAETGTTSAQQFGLYQDLILFLVYYRFREDFNEIVEKTHGNGKRRGRYRFYERFREELSYFLRPGPKVLEPSISYSHLFSYAFQVRRAFHHIFHYIIGTSQAARRLRSRVWQSIFTHDMARYLRSLSNRMGDIITLITGPSGSGKELVAQAIALSRFIPFDEEKLEFAEDFVSAYYPLNLTALSPTLIESELFGHRKGAFTGAVEDREGYLEVCGPCGTVFLDEIGDVDSVIQVKLLRTLQTRSFQRLGDTESRRFMGKIMAATNRDLIKSIEDGSFREDFYYRLCADRVETPALREILSEDKEECRYLVRYIAEKVAGLEEASELTKEVCDWIENRLGSGYSWPGNFRELEQCVRNILVHGEYQPQPAVRKESGYSVGIDSGNLSADELLRIYVTRVYAQSHN